MRILIMGGTRFIGIYLTKILVSQGHEVVLFNRGNKPTPSEGVQQIKGDRTDPSQLKDKLSQEQFDAVFDNNGRELSDTQPLAEIFKDKVKHFVYMSSAGVYLKSDQLPHIEGDPIDPKSRHKGKHETEAYLSQLGLPWTSIRPTYIYGPQNYNDLEAWFFDRIVRNRPIPIPGNGLHITQFGHFDTPRRERTGILGSTKPLKLDSLRRLAQRWDSPQALLRVCPTLVALWQVLFNSRQSAPKCSASSPYEFFTYC
ncbi:MAG: NAD-dependent epimerase/dehydratase family protein [Potamolinea sp.]